MMKIYRWAGYALALLASAFFVLYAIDNWQTLPAQLFDGKVLSVLVVAPFAYITGFLLTAAAWHILLRALGERSRPATALVILLISQFGKYLPGNFGHHVGRVVMARDAGLSTSSVVFSMTLEIGGAMLAGLGIGSLSLAVDGTSLLTGSISIPGPTKLILISLAITTLPLMTILLAKNFTSGRLRNIVDIDTMQMPNLMSLLACYFLYVANFFVLGSILYFLLSSLTDPGSGNFLSMTGLFAIIWLVGFVTPGAPGGLGVREALLVATLAPLYGPGIALSLAFGLRLITTIGDAIGFITGLTIRRWIHLSDT